MGLVRAWMLTCDAQWCDKHMAIDKEDMTLARVTALDHGWETVLLEVVDGWDVAWYCPQHRLYAEIQTYRAEDHEYWCPRRTRQGPCDCAISQRKPHLVDDGLGNAFRRRRGIESIRPFGNRSL